MKSLLVLGFVLSLGVSVSSQSCLDLNPLIGPLIPNVTIFDSPMESTESVCGGLWKDTKSCCKLDDLKKWSAVDKFVLSATRELIKVGLDFISAKGLLTGYPLKKVLTAAEVAVFNNAVSATAIGKIKDSTTKCTRYLEAPRSAALCFICSGDSASYFMDGRALISQQECSAMAAACGGFFYESLNLFKVMETTLEQVRVKKGISLATTEPAKVGLWQSSIMNTLTNFVQNPSSASKAEYEKEICDSLFNIVRNPVMNEMHKVIKQLSDQLQIILKLVATFRFLQLSKHQAESRSLFFGGWIFDDLVSFFTSETKVLNDEVDANDSDTVHAQASQGKKKMNLTTVFP